MDENSEESTRPRWDYIQFGIIFAGFGLASAAMIVGSIRGAMIGLLLMAVGLAYFLVRRSDLD